MQLCLKLQNLVKFWSEQPLTTAQPHREWHCHWHLNPVCFLIGYQTLGEEYVNIVQVDSTKKRVPSFLRRAIFIALHTVLPYCLEKGLLHLEHELQTEAESSTLQSTSARGLSSRRTLLRNWMQKQVGELTEEQKKRGLQVVHVLKQCIPLLHRLHLAVFYMSGTFYHLSKRIAGISYVSGCLFVWWGCPLQCFGLFWDAMCVNLGCSWVEYGQSRLGERERFNTA